MTPLGIFDVIGPAVMADESVWTAADALRVSQARAADVISLYPGKNGGLLGSIEVAHVAAAAGLPCHMGSNLELGIASAAMLHLASAVPNIRSERYPADILGPNYHEADLLQTPLDLGPEAARVPDGPGLGVELDEEQLQPVPASTANRSSRTPVSSPEQRSGSLLRPPLC